MIELLLHHPAYQRVARTWGDTYSPDMYPGQFATLDQLICSLELLWPEFVEIDEMVLRKSRLDNYQTVSWKNSSKTQIEYILNHIHLGDYFQNDHDINDIEESFFVSLGSILTDIWQTRLSTLFPEKTFTVFFDDYDAVLYAFIDRDDDSKDG